MIELRNKNVIINSLGEEVVYFDTFIDNEIAPQFNTRKYDNGEVHFEFEESFSIKQLLKKAGNCEINKLVLCEGDTVPFSISDFGRRYYVWEKLFFSDFLYIKSSNENRTIGFEFHLYAEELVSNWSYKYSVNLVFKQLYSINHKVANINIEIVEGRYFSFEIELKKEFATTLLSSYNELIKAIYEIEQEIYNRIEGKNTDMSESKSTVFISYNHKDSKWLKEMKRHFKPLENEVEFWDDTKILPGQEWRSEVEKALKRAKIGILMLSADFFNSDFILKDELPPLLAAAEEKGTVILSIVLRPCRFSSYPEISKYQFVNSPDKALSQMEESERELVFIKLIDTIEAVLRLPSKP